jgi:hypothetical protein
MAILISTQITGSLGVTQGITGSLYGTSSIANSFNPYSQYITISTSSLNWITCSFNNPDQYINLTTAQVYNFTASNLPTSGQISDVFLYINHTAGTTSSLSFPSNWKNMSSGWPSSLAANTIATLWIRAEDVGSIIGTFNASGSAGSSGTSLSTGSTYPFTASWASGSQMVSNGQSGVNPNQDAVDIVAGSTIVFTFGRDGTVNNVSYLPMIGNLTGNVTGTASYANYSDNFTASNSLLIGPGADSQAMLYVSGTIGKSLLEIDRYDGFEVFYVSASGNVVIGTSSFTSQNAESLYVNAINPSSYNIATFNGNVNNYLQINLSNDSLGVSSSGDFVVTSDSGSESYGYGDFGVNNGQWALATFTVAGPLDTYLYAVGSGSVGGNIAIGTVSNKSINFFTSGTLASNILMSINTGSVSSSVPILASGFTGSIVGNIYGVLTASSPTYRQGLLYYNTSSYCYTYFNETGSINVGREQQFRCYNSSSTTIYNGAPVYMSGSTGNYPNIYAALSDGTWTKSNVLGLATQDISFGNYGYVTRLGRVDGITRGLPFPVGTVLYLSPFLSGSLTSTNPTGSFESVNIGIVIASGSGGSTVAVDIGKAVLQSLTSSYAITASYCVTASAISYTTNIQSSASWASSSYTASNGAFSYGTFTVNGTTLATQLAYNATITRAGKGLYGISFANRAASNAFYIPILTGVTGSTQAIAASSPTQSFCSAFSRTATQFTMSCISGSQAVIVDICTGSFVVFGY